jgi:hypothetical protein
MTPLGSFNLTAGARSSGNATSRVASTSSTTGDDCTVGDKKTIYGPGGTQAVQNRYQVNLQGRPNQDGIFSASRWQTALFKKRKVEGMKKVPLVNDKDNVRNAGDLKIKFVKADKKSKKDLEVKYNSRKNKQRFEVKIQEGDDRLAKNDFRKKVSKEISKQMRKLSRSSRKFKEQQAGYMSSGEERSVRNKIKGSTVLRKTLSEASRKSGLGHTGSKNRSLVIKSR